MAKFNFSFDIEKMSSLPHDENNESMVVSVVDEIISGKKHETAPGPRFKLRERAKRETILLLDDSPIMKSFYKQMLEKNCFSVLTLGEEMSAVDFAAKNKPRLILVDDGGHSPKALRVAKQLCKDERTSSIPVLIMLPVDTFPTLRSKIKQYVDMCIPKTFTASILMPSLQSLLSS